MYIKRTVNMSKFLCKLCLNLVTVLTNNLSSCRPLINLSVDLNPYLSIVQSAASIIII